VTSSRATHKVEWVGKCRFLTDKVLTLLKRKNLEQVSLRFCLHCHCFVMLHCFILPTSSFFQTFAHWPTSGVCLPPSDGRIRQPLNVSRSSHHLIHLFLSLTTFILQLFHTPIHVSKIPLLRFLCLNFSIRFSSLQGLQTKAIDHQELFLVICTSPWMGWALLEFDRLKFPRLNSKLWFHIRAFRSVSGIPLLPCRFQTLFSALNVPFNPGL
jgi:hypothetical protein